MKPSFTVTLSSIADYQPVEVVSQRVLKGKLEYLVKWSLIEDNRLTNTTDVLKNSRDGLCKDYFVWMREDEMRACCDQLLSNEVLRAQPEQRGRTKTEEPHSSEEEPLTEMMEDIKNLISRAKRLASSTSLSSRKMLSNTINILSAYANIGPLANTFRENGALDLLLTLLASQDITVHKSAGTMLRSLTTFDLSSRAYVLLHLSKIDSAQTTSIQGRQMLLDLFSETASSAESDVLLKGITLPQVPGRYIFSILKKYLRVNSVSASSHSSQMEGTITASIAEPTEFEKFYALDELLSELFTFFGWFEGSVDKERLLESGRSVKGVSIFAGTLPVEDKPVKEKKNPYKSRDDFISDREYGRYVKATLQPGMKVRARMTYESVSAGDFGVYLQTNDGTPPAQFKWEGLGDTYWVYWHQIELLPPDEPDEPASPSTKGVPSPPKATSNRPYVMRALTLPTSWNQQASQCSTEKVERPVWWEVLCVLKSKAEGLVDGVIEILGNSSLKRFEDLIEFSPTYDQVAKVLEFMESAHSYLCQEPLTIREKHQFRNLYTDEMEKVPAATGEYNIDEDLEGDFRKEAPFPDPYHEEDVVHIPASIDFDDHPLGALMNMRRRREFPDALIQLRFLEHSQDGTMAKMISAKETVERVLAKAPTSCHVALQGIKVIKSGCEMIHRDNDRQEMCVSGLLSFVLRLMRISPRSFVVQMAGVECFFKLVGGYGIAPEFAHLDKSGREANAVSSSTRNVVITMLVSLAAVSEHGLKSFVGGMKCIVDYFHTHLPKTQMRTALTTVCGGLITLTLVLKDKDVVAKFSQWEVPELLKAIITDLPLFPGKRDLLYKISEVLPGTKIKDILESTKEQEDEAKIMSREVISVVKSLRHKEEIKEKNPLIRLISIFNGNSVFYKAKFVELNSIFVIPFLHHHGVYYLCQALEGNKNEQFIEHALSIVCSLIEFSEDAAAEVVLQGGLRAIVNILANSSSDRHKHTVCLRALEVLSKDPDHLSVMAAENIITPLNNAKIMFQDDTLGETVSRLTDMCDSEEASRAPLHQKILRIIFSGVLQLFLAAIEDSRREAEPVNLPRFSAFIKYLSAGSGGAVSALQKQWWDALEVSSNSQHKENLLDGSQSTYWESTGRSGTHWIRLHMKKGFIVNHTTEGPPRVISPHRKMFMEVSPNPPNFMPQKVSVHGGATADNAQEISSVYIPATFNGSYEIVTNAKKYYHVIIIRIKRCQMGGVDCRIHGLKCQATTSSLWPLFGDIFSARSKLFYQIQLQTWLKSSLGPLQLFDKLSAVILYEQMFGDSFLHTTQSRQCIGQACRSALVTPLIESLTKPNSGGPDLSELIKEYMSQMQAPLTSQWRAMASNLVGGRSLEQGGVGVFSMDILSQDSTSNPMEFEKAQKRLMKMSQIRRICRLMVDWDDGSHERPAPPRPEDKPRPRPHINIGVFMYDGTRIGADEILEAAEKARDELEEEERRVILGSGTIALARCWTGIVESQVTTILKQFNLESPYQVATELINIYDQLKQAMLELFGGHAQFALALKEGFSRAFQGLNEVTGVRFCEQLCLCVDSMMDVAGKDSARLHHMTETHREKMLLHFAEPLQFLHGLDLANIFEHYYRQHLSARVLRGRSISLLLEKRLSQIFAHCFPRKSPLQMLDDLESSQRLMDRFCDSELLESLDQFMLQASQQNTLSPEIMKLSQKCSLYKERVFQVYTLNPCFWPVRPRPLPITHLPPVLAQFCEDYIKFFSSAHEYGLQHYERPRRLQFTLQGWAVVMYDGVKLILSTVQMCVLLQFMNTTIHSLPSLTEATQLSYQDICESLLSLTSERQAVLTTTSSETTPTANDELLSSLQGTPFKASTLFKINKRFTTEVLTKHKSNRVRVHDVHLLARGQSTLLSHQDKAQDLAHVFERRRAVMDSAIVRILKKEKQMSVDNIAHKVIKGCSAGRFDRGASFGRFDCDYRDVCSRVDHLIVSGYIKRDMANRQMLVYIPDPNLSSNDTTTEDLPATKLQGAHSTKVSLESGTSNVAMTTTAPKSSRKRSGTSRQPQSKTKRKPPSMTRIYANEMYDQHEAPLLGMLPSLRSLGPAEVQAKINSLLLCLSPVLKLELHILEHLLHHHQWKTDQLIQQYLTDPNTTLEEAGLFVIPTSSPPARRRSFTCPVCMLSVSSRDLLWLQCNHGCCKSCWQYHLLTQIDLNRALLCSCPVFECPVRPTRNFFIKVFGADTDPINKFNKAVLHSYVERSNWLTWCRNPQGCTQVLCRGDGMDTGTCHSCKWTSCFSCTFIESHQPATCEDIKKWVELGGFYVGMDEDAKSKQLASIIAKKCPSCSAHIEKNEGCLHMKCKCGHDFCWKCLKPWKSHTDYFNCSAKLSKSAKDHKKFQDVNEICTSHHRFKGFAEKLCVLVKSVNANVPIRTLSFLSDACELLVQCHKMLMYTSVAEFFSKLDTSGYMGFLSESLEGDTTMLQAFLENTLIPTNMDVAKAISTLSERRLQEGYQLVTRIGSTRDKLLVGAQQQFKLGEITNLGSNYDDDDEEESEPSVSGAGPSSYLYMDYDDDDDDDFDDEDDLYGYSDYEDSYHDAFDSWDDGYDYDMFPYS